MRRVPPGRHVLVARDPSASAGDESSQGSTDELPPTTSHGYAEWDFSGVPDPVMFRRFFDATDYWFSYSDDSSAGSYDPARECCVVIANDPTNATDACQLGGATSDEVIISNLPLHLADSARTWLEHLPASQIHNWDDLVRTFVGNFQGTYVRPGNSWDLRSCTQKPGESLRDFIQRFSKRCTKVPSVAQSEIMLASLEGTTCRDLVRELGRSPPVDSNELFDIATSFASGEEAVGAIFDGKKGKRADDVPTEGSKSKELRQKNKRGKSKGHDDDDEALAVDRARRGPRPSPRGPGVFDDMLKKSCPYHKMPVNHTLEQCDMLKRFYGRAAARDDEAKKDGGDGDAGGFPAVENVFLIFGGATVDMSSRQRKRERNEVLVAEKAPPSFLDWSEDAITFSREDHPNRIPNPGQYLLVVDPVIGNTWFSKVLMDGGSSLNILYAHTLRLLGIGLNQLRPSTTPFHCVAPGKRVQPLGQIDLPVFGTPDNYRKETLTVTPQVFDRVN
jgi:hypothetical protein